MGKINSIAKLRECADANIEEFRKSYESVCSMDVYYDWYVIGFYENFYDLIQSDYMENLNDDEIKWLASFSAPIGYIYNEWLSCDDTDTGWENMTAFIKEIYRDTHDL